MESLSSSAKNKKTDAKQESPELNPEQTTDSAKTHKDKERVGLHDDAEMVIETSEKLEIIRSFDELNLREELLRGVYAYGFDKPSAVQKRAILPIIRNRDVIVQS